MPENPSESHRGEAPGGDRAAVSTGITPGRLRHIRYTPSQSFGFLAFAVLLPLAAGAIAFGDWMMGEESVWSVARGALGLLAGRPRGSFGAIVGVLAVAGGGGESASNGR